VAGAIEWENVLPVLDVSITLSQLCTLINEVTTCLHRCQISAFCHTSEFGGKDRSRLGTEYGPNSK